MRDILRGAVKMKATRNRGLGTEIASLFRKIGLDSDIPELRGHRVNPASFDRSLSPTPRRFRCP